MNNKKIEEMERIIGEQLGQASVLFMSQKCKGTEIVMPTEGLAVVRDNILEEFKKTLTQVHNSAIEGCVEMIKDEFIPPSYEGKPVLSELEMFLKQKLENLKIK